MENYILLIIGVGVLLYIVSVYNKIVRLREAVTSSEKEISVQLDRRGKVFDSLISTVKKYMDHESGVLTKVTELRSKINTENLSDEQLKSAQNELSTIVSSGALTSSLNLTMEAYPDLKANTNMLQLQEEITSTENKLSFAKKAFNNAIETYNVAKENVPEVFIVKMFDNLNKTFVYWELEETQIKTEENRRVEF